MNAALQPVTIVRHRDGWCALAAGADLDPDASSDPTLCGLYVTMRTGSGEGIPDCRDCLEILEGRALPVRRPQTRLELAEWIAELEPDMSLRLPRNLRLWLNHGRYWLRQGDGKPGYSRTPQVAAAKAWRQLRAR
jgi:hypothetical protein